MLRVCLIGAGRIGQVHARNIRRNEKTELVAVVDPNEHVAAAVAARCGGTASSDPLKAIRDPDVDAVVIATPEDTHVDLILAAAAAGKPIFCEKPIDIDLARVNGMMRTLKGSTVPIFVAFNRRFDPSRWALKEALDRGEIGTVEMVHITSRDPEPTPIPFIGGIFRNMVVHDFDMARWLLGEEPEEIFAYGSSLVDRRIGEVGDADTTIVVMKTPSGALAQINNSRRAVYGYDQRVEVLGSAGMLHVDNARDTTLQRLNAEGTHSDALPYFFIERYVAAFERELEHFVSVVRDGTTPLISAEDGRRALLLADAATRSMQTGRSVRLDYTLPA